MHRLDRASTSGLLALVTAAGLMIPTVGWTWGWATHHYIAQNYSKHLPAYIDGLKAYDSVVDAKVTDADARRSSTPGEAPRHYMDIDYYPEFHAGTLTHDRAALEAQYGAAVVLDKGIVPWAVGEVMVTLAQQFQAQQWSAAATTIADLCHYVGDATQPLHCTVNYNGYDTGNGGIHSRYETTMMTSSRIASLITTPTDVEIYDNAVDAMFDIVSDSWAGVSTVLQGDNTAKAASGGSTTSTTYYNSLWSSTETLTRSRIDAATLSTASFVHKAWIAAGTPTVPGSSAPVPAGVGPSPNDGVSLEASPTPFRDVLNIRFAGRGPLDIEVFDVRGARVDRVASGVWGAGTVSWRPARPVGTGLYLIRLTGPNSSVVRRVMRLQ